MDKNPCLRWGPAPVEEKNRGRVAGYCFGGAGIRADSAGPHRPDGAPPSPASRRAARSAPPAPPALRAAVRRRAASRRRSARLRAAVRRRAARFAPPSAAAAPSHTSARPRRGQHDYPSETFGCVKILGSSFQTPPTSDSVRRMILFIASRAASGRPAWMALATSTCHCSASSCGWVGISP